MLDIFGFFLCRDTDSDETKEKRRAYALWLASNLTDDEYIEDCDKVFSYLNRHMHEMGQNITQDVFDYALESFGLQEIRRRRWLIGSPGSLQWDDPLSVDQYIANCRGVLSEDYMKLYDSDIYDIEQFPINVASFFQTQKAKHLRFVFNTANTMIEEGTGRNGKIGSTDAADYVAVETAKLQYTYNDKKLAELFDVSRTPDEKVFEFVTDFGIPSLDADCGGIYTTQLFDLEAGPGVGKTRFLLGIVVYRTVVLYKKNVLIFALEQQKVELESMLISRHIFERYQLRISDAMILKNELETDEQRALVAASRFDLFESGNYGTVYMRTGPLFINDMINNIKVLDALHGPFPLICIDYMYMLRYRWTQELGRLDRTETIRLGYQYLKEYLGIANKAGFTLNQLNREGVEAAKADKEIDETMGAGGLEVFRSTDYNTALTRTDAMEAQGLARLQNVKKRSSRGAGRILLATAQDVCIYQEKGDNL